MLCISLFAIKLVDKCEVVNSKKHGVFLPQFCALHFAFCIKKSIAFLLTLFPFCAIIFDGLERLNVEGDYYELYSEKC